MTTTSTMASSVRKPGGQADPIDHRVVGLSAEQVQEWRTLVAWCERNRRDVGTVSVSVELLLAVDAELHSRKTSPGPSPLQRG